MKILHVYNRHRGGGGADNAWDQTIRYSIQRGLDVATFERDSKSLKLNLSGKLKAFAAGIYGWEAVKEFRQVLADFSPDIVHAHELMPLISPWILPECSKAKVPVVFTCYDFRLTCPVFTHFHHGQVCLRCQGGHEYHAVLNNCRGNYAESLSYALWNTVARHFRLHDRHVAQFIALSPFVKDWLIAQGIAEHRISVIPCAVNLPERAADPAQGQYIAYAGRFVEEKGVEVLIKAARIAQLPVKLAGNFPEHPAIQEGDPVECVTINNPVALAEFYRGARMLVMPSIWFETFGIVAAEAMSHGIPVLASRIGALRHTVNDGVSGMLFEPHDAEGLAAMMLQLWNDPALLRHLGEGAFQQAHGHYDAASCFGQLLQAYGKAQQTALCSGT